MGLTARVRQKLQVFRAKRPHSVVCTYCVNCY